MREAVLVPTVEPHVKLIGYAHKTEHGDDHVCENEWIAPVHARLVEVEEGIVHAEAQHCEKDDSHDYALDFDDNCASRVQETLI